jgi:hypothetical protein
MTSIRDLYARLARAEMPHVAEEAWERLALGEAEREERQRIVDHVVRCLDCATVYRGLAELETEAREFDPGVPARPVLGQAAWQSGLRPWGFLGGMAAAAALVWALARPALAPAPPVATSPVMRGAEAARPRALAPGGRQTSWPEAFRWEPLAGARAYRVELFDASATPVWQSAEMTETTLSWPAWMMLKDGTYYWQVVAIPESGRLADGVASALVKFEIAVGPPPR